MAKLAVLIGLIILCAINPLLFFALALLWWGSGVLARRQGLLVEEAEEPSAPPEASERTR